MSIAISDHLARPYRFYLLIWCLNTDILINSNQFIKTKPSLETRDFLSFQVLKSFIFRMKLDTVTTQDNDPTCVTYIINGEDDTLGNSLRLIIASYKEVELCQYTRPHPTEDCIHLRIQTYGKTPGIPEQIKYAFISSNPIQTHILALEMLKRGLNDLIYLTEKVEEKFVKAEQDFVAKS